MVLFYLLTLLVTILYAFLILSYRYGWKKTIPNPLTISHQPLTFVSVIIPARNEEQNILSCLDAINKQKYPQEFYEVIVVSDHSTDSTEEMVRSKNYSNVKLLRLPENNTGKKAALAEGIKNANGKLIITTDADCEMGENWLSSIMHFYEEKKPKMIVAPVLINAKPITNNLNTQYSVLNTIMQSQEMTVLTASACGSLYWNRPILCSGANLIYEKDAFCSVNGFEGIDQTATGDDIFLMLKFQEKFPKEIKYLRSKDAVVFTNPSRSASEALRQRKRWASKGFSYGSKHITWITMLVFFTNFLILLSGILSVINIKFVLALIISFSVKCLVDFMLLYAASSFFEKRTNPFIFVTASIIYPVYVSIIGLISPFTNYSWKSRIS